MKVKFERVDDLADDEIQVVVRSRTLTKEAKGLLDDLSLYQGKRPGFLPVKDEDRIVMLKVDELIYVDVEGAALILETVKGTYRTVDRLYKFREKLNHPDMVQVSKQTLLNIQYLEALEAGFSGNMIAILSGKRKVHVSRRYLKELEKRLGL